ncbi:MAG: hypothetical protein ACOCP8_02300 [archaeon]
MNHLLEQQKHYYMNIWNTIIIPHSSDNYNSILNKFQKEIDNVINELKINNFSKFKGIATQLDKIVVEHIIDLCIETKDVLIIDKIFKRTRSAISKYFYHQKIVQAYLILGFEDKAIDVLKYIINKNHIAHWYTIYNYNPQLYKNSKKFHNRLIHLRTISLAKLLLNGEKLNIKNFSLDELESLSDVVIKYKNKQYSI